MAGDDECVLPQRVTPISRQGVSWTLLDPQDFLDNGRTGIYHVDLFLRTVNPDRARLRSRVFSPDLHRAPGLPLGTARQPGPSARHRLPRRPQLMSRLPHRCSVTATPSVPTAAVQVYPGRPLRWVVPGSSTGERPPMVTVRPSGEEVPPDALSWRSGNYTLDLTTEQVEQLLPPGSVLVVSTTADDGSTTSRPAIPWNGERHELHEELPSGGHEVKVAHAKDSPSSRASEQVADQPRPAVGSRRTAAGDNEPPDGTSAEVLDWVGDDQERAQAALDKEQADEKPRSGLTEDLQKILGPRTQDEDAK